MLPCSSRSSQCFVYADTGQEDGRRAPVCVSQTIIPTSSRTAVSFWGENFGQIPWDLARVSPKRDWTSKRVKTSIYSTCLFGSYETTHTLSYSYVHGLSLALDEAAHCSTPSRPMAYCVYTGALVHGRFFSVIPVVQSNVLSLLAICLVYISK